MIGIALGLAVLVGAGLGWSGVAVAAGFAGIATLLAGRVPFWTVLLVVLSIAGAVRVNLWAQDEPLIWPFKPEEITGEIVSGPVETGKVQRFDVLGTASGDVGEFEPIRICVTAPVAPRVFRGDRVNFSGKLSWFDEIEPEFRGALTSRGCSATLFASTVDVVSRGTGIGAWFDQTRRRLVDVLHRAAPGDAGALLAGLVTGDDAALLPVTHDAFVVTGTSHVTAVSGSNLALIVTIVMMAGMAAGLARRWYWQVLVVVTLWGYVGLVGPSPPPVRAAGVATFAVIAVRMGRKPDFITLSFVVAAIEVLWRPEDFATLAFRLSTVSSIALVLGLGGVSPRGWKGWLKRGIIATAITQVATSALLIPAFGRLSIVSIPANLVIGPLCAIAFPLALVGSFVGLVSQLLGQTIIVVASVPATIAIEAATHFARIPGADDTYEGLKQIPIVAVALLSLSLVAAMSRETRGGIRRIGSAYFALDLRSRAILTGTAAGTATGIILGQFIR